MSVSKTEQLLTYMVKFNEKATITGLMKLSYLIDIVAVKRNKEQISSFRYRRYTHGPFDGKIYEYITDLVKKGILIEETDYSPLGLEYTTYRFNDEAKYDFSLLDNRKEIIDDVLEGLKGYSVKTLKEIAYKTEPMKKINATMGGMEHFNKIIPLNI